MSGLTIINKIKNNGGKYKHSIHYSIIHTE
jgi:hypothetical protein